MLRRLSSCLSEVVPVEVTLMGVVVFASLLASVGFWFGITVGPHCFWLSMVALSIVSALSGWRRFVSFVILISACLGLTMFTFSYVGADAQTYHFPMQYLLHHGWNPVFDSTVEKLRAITGPAQLNVYHTLFLFRFSSLCGAVVASGCNLFSGDGFLGYVLIVSLFSYSLKFARSYWCVGFTYAAVFASAVTFSTKMTSFLAGQVDYSTYASFCLTAFSLCLYIRHQRLSDLFVFSVAAVICVSAKTTGVLSCGVLVAMLTPFVWKRRQFWIAGLIVLVCFLSIESSPLFTAWVQYGSPLYPLHSFDPRVAAIDITHDFTGNADALRMGYVARICYAWISPDVVISFIRWWTGNSSFSPIFTVCGGVAGFGLWFNALLAASLVLLLSSRKNLVSYLCVIVFVTANFAPLKYIGYMRYFPQIWIIVPLAFLNFIAVGPRIALCPVRFIAHGVLTCLLVFFAVLFALRTLAYEGRMLVLESARQNVLERLSVGGSTVRVAPKDYRFTNVARFRQAGLELVLSDEATDICIDEGTSFLYDCGHPEHYQAFERNFPICNSIGSLLSVFKWGDVIERLPNVLWDANGVHKSCR